MLHGRWAGGHQQQQPQRSGVRRSYAGSATLLAYVVAEHRLVSGNIPRSAATVFR